jgi:hypothetical protein
MLNEPSRRTPFWGTIGLTAALTVAYLVATLVIARIGQLSPDGRLVLELGLGVGFMAAILVICVRWWRARDEAQQEAWKWAWYWGSTFGLPVLVPFIFVLVADHNRLLAALVSRIGADNDIGAAFAIGILAALLPMIVGTSVAWGVWWSRRR